MSYIIRRNRTMAKEESFISLPSAAVCHSMNEATIDRFTPIQMSQPDSVVEILRRVVPAASDHSLRVCDVIYSGIRDKIKAADGLESEAMYGVTDSAESFQAYQQMYEKGIISTNAENILSEFEKLIFRLIK